MTGTRATRRRRAFVVIGIGLAMFLLAGAVTAASTTTTPPGYYDNNTTVTGDDEWMDGNEEATFDSVLTFVTRIGTFVVGSGGSASAVGSLITSVVVGGIVMGILGGTAVGIVGGVTVTTMTLGALAAAGMVPIWLWAMVVFGIGVTLTTIFIRSLQ